ncbi:class I SAM-dependent methyltransferase [Clostridium perfringens]|uniref:Class I SAM-dependent methyltransferase n=2 Tax=Clostridium perfringens TaxID=1502 RepID=A0A501UQ91_CLOPF|nr:class I SAM-dependent methyltransferase [Clostridium perfringens]ALG49507.1 Methyltransferase [Clostridium perfringens]EGS9998173.1 class I SAM-dependent methyltransferase [Clostridium perfringens]EGT3598703.1 class I SAM-dependent methyltransferase [Clostridium perfringens]EGT4143293.1 class I SAM-dependent methyltransferase [Clostridium perfringens]EHK2333931.1 class I SAM-dependent methyltransferase [Clostridium perfringens]
MKSYKMMAKVYDELIYEDVNYENIAEYALSKCDKYNINKEMYLDLACGTGNVGVHVGKSFKENYFVDLSQDMLIEADKKLREHRVRGKIVCQDMCELELNRKFDLITCVLDSTNYILDDESVENYLRGVYNHLKEDGLFVFDINSYYKISEVLGNNVYTYDSEELFYAWENIFEDEIVEMNLNFFVKDGEKYERFTEVHEERAYKESEIEYILDVIGFKIVEKHNGYTEDEVTPDTERIVYIVKK